MAVKPKLEEVTEIPKGLELCSMLAPVDPVIVQVQPGLICEFLLTRVAVLAGVVPPG